MTSTYINSIKIAKHQHHGRCPSANAYKESHDLGRVVERIGLLPINALSGRNFFRDFVADLPFLSFVCCCFFSEALRLKGKFFSNWKWHPLISQDLWQGFSNTYVKYVTGPLQSAKKTTNKTTTATNCRDFVYYGPHPWRLTAGT